MLKCLKLAFLLVLIASVSIDAKQYKCKTQETGNSVSQPASQPDNTASSAPASQPGSQTGSQAGSQPASSQTGSQAGSQASSQPASSQSGSQANSQAASTGSQPSSQTGSQASSQPASSQTGSQTNSQPAASTSSNNDAPIWNWRTNKSYGLNIGNWLVLERWMDWNWFDSVANGGTDEWTLCQNLGKDKAAQVLTDHWNNWLKESDVAVMAQYGINMLRVPVGFWAFIDVWDSEPYVTTGQKDQLARLMEYVNKYNMYIILDLHGMPGSQNGQDHSGHAGEIGFFKTPNLQRGLQTIQAMVDWAKASPYSSRIAAIECANEPHPYINDRWPRLVQFYQDSYKIINAGGFAMMFHDGFQGLDKWSGYFTNGENAIIDLHPYWAFSGSQTQDKVTGEVCALGSQYASFHLPVFAGEFSVAATDVQGSQWWYQRFYETQYKQWLQSAGGTFWAYNSLFKAVGSLPWSWMDLVGNNAIPTDPTDVSASAC